MDRRRTACRPAGGGAGTIGGGEALTTLGIAYGKNPRFAGATYHSVLKRVESFFDEPVSKALPTRRKRAKRLLTLDAAVGEIVAELKKKGFESPYLKPFVVARINPLRWKKGDADFDETMDTMLAAAKQFDVAKIKPRYLLRSRTACSQGAFSLTVGNATGGLAPIPSCFV